MASATGRALHRYRLDSIEDQCVTVSCQVFRCVPTSLWSQACSTPVLGAADHGDPHNIGHIHGCSSQKGSPHMRMHVGIQRIVGRCHGGVFVCAPCIQHGMSERVISSRVAAWILTFWRAAMYPGRS